nr:MAG TPA: hypothetical protein [Caudoviricetes sp.]
MKTHKLVAKKLPTGHAWLTAIVSKVRPYPFSSLCGSKASIFKVFWLCQSP